MDQSSSTRSAASDTEERTRDRVLGAVLEHGPVSAADLGELLGFTPAAVRRHLDTLTTESLIEVKHISNAASGAGRPARRYVVSPHGQAHLGNDYLALAREALAQLDAVGGADAVNKFTAERYRKMEDRLRPVVEAAGPELADRADALAEALTREGYVASSTHVPARELKFGGRSTDTMASIQLCQGHCPVRDLAAEYPVFCDAETEVFSRLLGVDVRRLSTLAGGGHVCTTHIPMGRKTTASNHQQERP